MSIREYLKRVLPSYRIERRLTEELQALRKDLREMDKKNEYLFWRLFEEASDSNEAKRQLFRQLPKANGKLRQIQLAENYILRRIKRICDENGIQFFLIGGTLLGAHRHQGFIPWDNDIDIGMMKDDYLKLREILKDDEELSLEYYYIYKEGLRISKVKFKDSDVFFIDIFTFSYVDTSDMDVKEAWGRSVEINQKFCEKLKECSADYAGVPLSRPACNKSIDLKMEEYETEHVKPFEYASKKEYFYVSLDCPYWCRNPRGIKSVSQHFPLKKNAVLFEGETYDVWNNYEEALEFFYGDYCSFPFSISAPHTTEFDDGFDEALQYIKGKGIV